MCVCVLIASGVGAVHTGHERVPEGARAGESPARGHTQTPEVRALPVLPCLPFLRSGLTVRCVIGFDSADLCLKCFAGIGQEIDLSGFLWGCVTCEGLLPATPAQPIG